MALIDLQPLRIVSILHIIYIIFFCIQYIDDDNIMDKVIVKRVYAS